MQNIVCKKCFRYIFNFVANVVTICVCYLLAILALRLGVLSSVLSLSLTDTIDSLQSHMENLQKQVEELKASQSERSRRERAEARRGLAAQSVSCLYDLHRDMWVCTRVYIHQTVMFTSVGHERKCYPVSAHSSSHPVLAFLWTEKALVMGEQPYLIQRFCLYTFCVKAQNVPHLRFLSLYYGRYLFSLMIQTYSKFWFHSNHNEVQ